MPNKSRRVAVKQAQLSHKKKRVTRDSSLVEGAHSGIQLVDSQDHSRSNDIAPTVPRQAVATRPDVYTKGVTGNSRPANQYIWPEMRRIGILTGLVLGILVILTFVLG